MYICKLWNDIACRRRFTTYTTEISFLMLQTLCMQKCQKDPDMCSTPPSSKLLSCSPSVLSFTPEETLALNKETGPQPWSSTVFERATANGTMFHAKTYTRPKKTRTFYIFIMPQERLARVAKILEVVRNGEKSWWVVCDLISVSNRPVSHIHVIRDYRIMHLQTS